MENQKAKAIRNKAYRKANKEKADAQQRAWREKNKDRDAANKKRWAEANKERKASRAKIWREFNKETIAAKHKAYYEANKGILLAKQKARYETDKESILARNRFHKYGISEEQFTVMLESQSNRCKCCKTSLKSLPLHRIHIDHCHRTGFVRGILCNQCNTTIGNAGEDPDRLRSCACYLEQSERGNRWQA